MLRDDDPLVGEVLGGRFRLERKLGEGGMGAVYAAVHTAIGSRAAVKVLRPRYSHDKDVVRRFQREARAAASVGHEAIVGVQDMGNTASGAPYIVMEMLPGESLAERLDSDGRLGIPLTAYVCCQMLSGLAAAHDAGIVHRDLKPENIFLVATKSPLPAVKILDFGISKIVSPSKDVPADPTRLTKTGVVIGTPEYMSPEHAAGARDLDHRTDLWAVGVILYECLTGAVPFTGETPARILLRIHSDTPIAPRQLNPALPEELEAIVLKAMEKKRQRRYRSAYDMFEALVPYVESWAMARVSVPEAPSQDLVALTGDDATATTVQPAGLNALVGGMELTSTTFDDHPAGLGQGLGIEETEIDGGMGGLLGPDDPEMTDTRPDPRGAAGQRTTTGRRRRPVALVGFLVLGAVAILAGALLGLNAIKDDPVEPPGVRVSTFDAGTAAAGLAPGVARPAAGVTEEADELTIELLDVPADAVVYLDNVLNTSRPLSVVRDGERHTVRVEAAGFEAFEEEVVAGDDAEDRTVRVTLRRPRVEAPRTPRRPPRRPRPDPPPSGKVGGGSTRPPPGEYRPPRIDMSGR